MDTHPLASTEEGGILWCALGATSLHPASVFLWWAAVEYHQGSSCATHKQDDITEGWEMERSAYWVCRRMSQHLDVGVRDSGIIATFSYTENGNVAFLILNAWSKGLPLDIWLPMFPSAWLKETEFMGKKGHGNISYFVKWT